MKRTTPRLPAAAALPASAVAALLVLVACAGEPAAEPTERLEVEAVSYAYQPAAFTVGPGTIRFVVSNADASEVHGFEVEGHGMEEEIDRIEPGSVDSLDVTLTEPGAYEIYCPVEDHEERGMVARLTVEGAATP